MFKCNIHHFFISKKFGQVVTSFSFFFCLYPGFEALTEIQNLLNSNNHDPSILESLIVDASNRFFTVIPSIHPHVIRDEDDFKSKVGVMICCCIFLTLHIFNPLAIGKYT